MNSYAQSESYSRVERLEVEGRANEILSKVMQGEKYLLKQPAPHPVGQCVFCDAIREANRLYELENK